MVVQSVKGLLELPDSLDLQSNFRAELTHLFHSGHPPHLISPTVHRVSHWINKTILEELLLLGEPRIQPLVEWSNRLLELTVKALKVWDKVILWWCPHTSTLFDCNCKRRWWNLERR